jgi:hypothetical protein
MLVMSALRRIAFTARRPNPAGWRPVSLHATGLGIPLFRLLADLYPAGLDVAAEGHVHHGSPRFRLSVKCVQSGRFASHAFYGFSIGSIDSLTVLPTVDQRRPDFRDLGGLCDRSLCNSRSTKIRTFRQL